jgi:hypothetical protein
VPGAGQALIGSEQRGNRARRRDWRAPAEGNEDTYPKARRGSQSRLHCRRVGNNAQYRGAGDYPALMAGQHGTVALCG